MLLAIDTSTAACSVALIAPTGEVDELRPGAERLRARPAHTRELLPAVAELLTGASATFDSLTGVAVGVGPGAFTGLRIGVATARAIASAREIPITPVSSLAALAAGAEAEAEAEVEVEAGGRGAVLALTDARRGEIFVGLYDAFGAALAEDSVRPAGELPEFAEWQRRTRGRLLAVGDAVPALRQALADAGVESPGDADPRHVISAAAVARLAAAREPKPASDVLPNYIRPPDAKQSSREHWIAAVARPGQGGS